MQAKEILKNLTNKKYIYLVDRGNTAIQKALEIVAKPIILIPDQGGWFLYKKIPNTIELKTDYGILDLEDLKSKANKNTVLLVNSLAGYFAEQPMQEIEKICKENSCLIINDVSASIGTELAKFGNFIIGSFGKWKPVDLGYGGFIAANLPFEIKENFKTEKLKALEKKLKELPARLKKLHKLAEKVKKDLKNFEIIHKIHKGLNVIVKYKNEKEKQKIIEYCNKNKFEFVLCPNYIKVNEKAISIEVKRL